MAKHAGSLLLVNLCCETLFVIEQRLVAQSIQEDKRLKVITEMAAYIFGERLWGTGELHTLASARRVIEGMCNCSIMKLNGSSMDKLFDLAVMMFKYQMMCSKTPEQIVEVSILHLLQVDEMLQNVTGAGGGGGGGGVLDQVTSTRRRVESMYGGLRPGELHRIRHTLLAELQHQWTKISLLLTANIQNDNGTFKLPVPYSDRLGLVSLYDIASGEVESQTKLSVYDALSHLYEFYDFPTPLGSNMYVGHASGHTDRHALEPNTSRSPSEAVHGWECGERY